jgi:hypothetical protein
MSTSVPPPAAPAVKIPSDVPGCEFGSGELGCDTTELVSPATDEISHQGVLSLP